MSPVGSFDFFFGVFLFLLLRALSLLYNLLAFPRARPAPLAGRVSLLIPARNEAENLRHTLPTLLRQEAEEILLLDDLSEDGTAQVALEIAGSDPRFRLLRGKPPPEGWRGKNWACHQLALAARGEILVFADADVAWEEGALGGVVEALGARELVSFLPRQAVGLGEGAVVAFVMNGFFSFLPHPLLEGLRVANGQVLAFRREAYWALGGHEGVRGAVLEDVALARRSKAYRLLLGTELFEARMYRGYGQAVGGFAKNFLAIHLGHPGILLGSAFYHLALYTLPWLFGRLELGLLGILERLLVQWALKGPLWPALLSPLAPLLLLPVYLGALLPGKRWKGRPL